MKSRYLLTFASAATANEWWLLIQTNFPDVSRPGPQLFSFKTDDLLTRAWRHPSFAHLKTKWMYISFSDAPGDGLGGAAQGIIPVQDEHGNMLGGGAPASPQFARELRSEARSVKTEVQRLEEYFGKMTAAVERNTEKVAELAEKRRVRTSHDETLDALSLRSGSGDSANVDMGVLSGQFVRMNDLLAKNSQHVEQLAKQHYEHERKLSQTMNTLVSQRNDGTLDMHRLSTHLDRIQTMMEASTTEREDSAKHFPDQQSQTVQIDWSPLTERLEKVVDAVEQNSALVKALLDEGAANSHPGTPFWGKEQPVQPDFQPLTQHLQGIHQAIEQQGEHMKALVKFAARNAEGKEPGNVQPNISLAPLSEHLEQVYNAIDEGNRRAKEAPKFDLNPLSKHLEALTGHSQSNLEIMDRLVESQIATRQAVEAKEVPKLDLHPLAKHLEALRDHSESHLESLNRLVQSQDATRNAVEAKEAPKFDLDPLSKHLEVLRGHSQSNVDSMSRLVESQEATREAVEANGGEIDFTPMTEYLEAIRQSSDAHTEATNKLLASQEATREHTQRLVESQEATREAVEANGGEIDFTPMVEYLDAIKESSDTHTETVTELLASQEATRREMLVDFTPLTDHLTAVQEATNKNSEHLKSLIESHKASLKAAQSSNLDRTPLTERLDRIHAALESESERRGEGIGDARFIMNALTSHLSKIQGVTDQNAQHVKALREKHSSSGDKMHIAVSETSEQVRLLMERNKDNEANIAAQNSQMRELMSGQREMVEVMRQLAKSVVAQNKGSCDHVVVPPPRKMGRKVVGFVYDAKEGPPS